MIQASIPVSRASPVQEPALRQSIREYLEIMLFLHQRMRFSVPRLSPWVIRLSTYPTQQVEHQHLKGKNNNVSYFFSCHYGLITRHSLGSFNSQVSIQAPAIRTDPTSPIDRRRQAHSRWLLRPALVATGCRKALPVQHASPNWLFRHSRLPGRRRLQLSIAYDAVQPRQAACLTAAASRIASVSSSCSV